jgi:hypothetical protein
MQDVKPQLVWPPVLVGGTFTRRGVMNRAFAFFAHGVFSFLGVHK